MRSIYRSAMLCCAIAVLIAFASLAFPVQVRAQAVRQPGLWEITTTMTWQQSPLPPNVPMPENSPFSGAPHTTQVCMTQAMIDKYGAQMPQSHGGDCAMTNVVKTADSMSGTWTCTGGQMSGTGTVESHLTTAGHAAGKIHFTGTMTMGQRSTPVEWTSNSTSVFKSPDCGSVKPLPMPAEK